MFTSNESGSQGASAAKPTARVEDSQHGLTALGEKGVQNIVVRYRPNLLVTVLVAVSVIGFSGAPAADALHWSLDVSVSPSQVEASSEFALTMTLTNTGTTNISLYDFRFSGMGYGIIGHWYGLFSIPPGGTLPLRIPFPSRGTERNLTAPAEPGLYKIGPPSLGRARAGTPAPRTSRTPGRSRS